MTSLRDFARDQLDRVEQRVAHAPPRPDGAARGHAGASGGREFVSFSCNDYLGLTHHPAVIASARDALDRHGTGAGASRLVTGSHPLYAELESLARRHERHRAVARLQQRLHGECRGHPGFVGKDDLILADRLCHACMWDGARLSGATVMRFDHNSVDRCAETC